MSPVRVKLGDFGASKWIQAPAITTLHTQVSTPLYGAPEVLGLDSNSESSDYTNSVDIWSLGCVIYELLVGRKLFASWDQVSRFFFGKRPFPEDILRGLSSPTDEIGISLLKSMLLIQPGDRPTVADALNHVWLADLANGNEHSREDEGRTPPSRDESTPSKKRKNRLAPHGRPGKRRGKRGPPTQDDARCMTRDVGSGVNPRLQSGGELTPWGYN